MPWSLIFTLVVFYVSHSFFAHASVKRYLYAFIPFQYYRLAYNTLSVLLLGLVVWTYWDTETKLLFTPPYGLTIIGWGLLTFGFLLNFYAIRQYDGLEFMGVRQLGKTEEDQLALGGTLNVSGLNAYVRHPIYAAAILIVWSWFLIHPSHSVLSIAGVTTAYTLIGIQLEEEKLIEAFGAAYLDYQKRVKMLIPGVFSKAKGE